MGSVSAFVKAIHPHIQIEIEKKKDTFLVHVFKFILQEQGLDFSPH